MLFIVPLLSIAVPSRAGAQIHTPPQSSDPSEVLLSNAKSLFAQARFAEAGRAVRQYLQDHANSAEGHFLLGHILFREIQAQTKALETQFPSQTHGPMASGTTMGATSPEVFVSKGAQEMAKGFAR